jgi:uncharacterized protein (DUF488 family)
VAGTIFTLGHGTRSSEELTVVAAGSAIGRIVDVRRFPGSRRHPQFAREELEQWLPAAGIGYVWEGEDLGGRRSRTGGVSRHPAWRNAAFQSYADHTDSPAYREAIEKLEEESRSVTIGIMCAETLWWRCHRRLIADTFELRGTTVMHLIKAGSSEPHSLHPAVRLGADGWPVYDVGETAGLSLEN